jgi:hypothetical protein|tara:strand:- start:163 stop:441 length:279 start_codon:yes stop_codon:yes gene_type:complete
MLKNKPNALNFFGIRRMEVPPKHFEYIVIEQKYNLEISLDKWITQNLRGKYYLGSTLAVGQVNGLDTRLKVGFEDAKELSYFTLACPLLKYN